MGIKQLAKLIADVAPGAVREQTLNDFTGRTIAIDASMAIYQFLVAVRAAGDGGIASMLTNEAGEVTSHLQGMFSRTIRMMESGIKPVFVFDGKAPDLKKKELAKRSEAKEAATASMKEATEAGNVEDINKFSRRTVRMTRDHQEDCKRLLSLMGMPVITAPCEAEAQCAKLAADGKVYAAGSEDMDTLTFGSPVLVRRLTFSDARGLPVLEFKLDKALEELGLTMEQFVDLCILCGCDYCDNIRGIGPKKALTLIKKHGDLAKIVDTLKEPGSKHVVPEDFDFEQARRLFLTPDVTPGSEVELKWSSPNEEDLMKFLVEEKGFNPDRVKRGIEKLKKAKGAASQKRMDSFFKVISKPSPATKRKTPSKGSNTSSNKSKMQRVGKK